MKLSITEWRKLLPNTKKNMFSWWKMVLKWNPKIRDAVVEIQFLKMFNAGRDPQMKF